MNKIYIYGILIFTCIISALSQVLLKKASEKKYKSFLFQYLNINVITAYFLFFTVVIINSILLRYISYSVASAISESMPCVLSIISGAIFFHESISKKKIVCISIIILGIVVIVI